MQGGSSGARRRALTRHGVMIGSVWETRMKMDEVKGGIKVFNGSAGRDDDSNTDEDGLRVYRRLRRNQRDGAASAAGGKRRKNWGPPDAVAINGSAGNGPVQLRKARSELSSSRRISGGDLQELEEETGAGDSAKEEEIREKRVLLIGNGSQEGEEDGEEKEIELEDDKEMDRPKEKTEDVVEEQQKGINDHPEEEQKPVDMETDLKEDDPQEKSPIPLLGSERTGSPAKKPPPVIDHRPLRTPESNPAPAVDHRTMNPEPIRTPEKKTAPKITGRAVKSEPPIKQPQVDVYEQVQGTTHHNQSRIESIVDLVMWRDVSKSAFVFGFGTFLLVSSSYAKDLNFSIISAVSYLGLVYLGLIFIYKSILHRGASVEFDEREERCMVGEEEAIWLVRLILPYINELLLKLRALFSGDPATTMKLALLLFAMARCGSFVTLWTLAKLVFFGVFTIPKVCSSYSTQLARYGRFWVERFRDGWESCNHKKAVAAAAFTLVWNVSSTVARSWAVFMLVVAVKYYRQRMAQEGWKGEPHVEEDVAVAVDEGQEDSSSAAVGPGRSIGPRLRQRRGPGPAEFGREKKRWS